MTEKETAIRNKLLTGIQVSYNDLVRKKRRQDAELFFSSKGKIVGKRASDITLIDIKSPYPHSK